MRHATLELGQVIPYLVYNLGGDEVAASALRREDDGPLGPFGGLGGSRRRRRGGGDLAPDGATRATAGPPGGGGDDGRSCAAAGSHGGGGDDGRSPRDCSRVHGLIARLRRREERGERPSGERSDAGTNRICGGSPCAAAVVHQIGRAHV